MFAMEYLKQKTPFLARDLNLDYRTSSSTELNFDLPNLGTLEKLSLDRFLRNFVILSQTYNTCMSLKDILCSYSLSS